MYHMYVVCFMCEIEGIRYQVLICTLYFVAALRYVQLFCSWGTAWDKRMAWEAW